MERFKIEADSRLLARRVRTAIQGNVIPAIIELVSNSDDSYRELEQTGLPTDGLIKIRRDGQRGLFSVRDKAEGMSYEELRQAFKKYGAFTSGLKDGKAVTGFFGTGAKNALAGMTDGRICTFKDDLFTECRVFFDGGDLTGEIDGPHPVTKKLRLEHDITGNGTAAYFVADPTKGQRIPRFDTVQESLAGHWRLRKIMTNPKRKVLLVDVGEKRKPRRLRYIMPKGKELLSEHLKVSCEHHGDFPIHLSIWRAESELSQMGDERRGGLLILDEGGAVLDMSLFKYDHEPFAARLFGEVVFGRFQELLKKEEPVLKEERVGLDRKHPVCQTVILEIEKHLGHRVKDEQRRQREARSRFDTGESARYRNAFKILNEIAELEAEVTNLGQEPSDEIEPPPNGLCLYPDSAHITVGKRYGFEVRIDTKTVRPGSLVKLHSSNPRVRIIGNTEFRVARTDGARKILQRYVTVEGATAGARATLHAAAGNLSAEATVFVEPEPEEKEQLLNEGLVFRPETLTVRMNRPRRTSLRVYIKIVEGESRIVLSSDNDSVHVEPDEVIVREADAKRHVAEYPIEVWGDEPDVNAVVTAEHEGRMALLEVRVREDEKKEKEKGKGIFSEPEFNTEELEPLMRTQYSPETGKVIIYVNFPSIKHYLGADLRYEKTLAAQVFIADLVAERCFLEIARIETEKKRSREVTLSPEARVARIQRTAQDLSKKYGQRVHKALVEQTLLQEDQTKTKSRD